MSHVDEGQLHGYLDGELSPTEARAVDAHVAQCPDCRRRLDEERALIARAAELLSLAAPPDRTLPPFRAGDVKPPARLWWQVRLPLAWAATVVLALGIGRYLGSRSVGRERASADQLGPVVSTKTSARARGETAPPARKAAAAAGRETPGPAPTPAPGALATREAARNLPVPAPAAGNRVSNSVATLPRPDSVTAPAARADLARASTEGVERRAWQDERDAWQLGNAVTIDSARRVLGTDPLALPGVPIEAVYLGRRIGYSDVVIVEQALDSTTTIRVINARAAPQFLSEVVVTGQVAPRSEPAPSADSFARRAKRAAPTAAKAAGEARPNLFREVRGPLSADSLAALRRRLQPLRP